MALTKIRQEQGVIINDGSTDVDFRVESNGNANMLFVDGGNDRVGIGTSVAPAQKLTVTGVSGANVGGLTNGILALTTGTGAIADTRLLFGIVDDSYGWIQAADYGVAYRNISLNPNGGNVGIGTSSPTTKFHVQGPTGDGDFIASFDGSDVNQGLFVANFLCGSDEDRVGLYWENQGVGNFRNWCDDSGDLRIQNANPTANDSGTVVGTQTFTGTHIYKTDATDLTVGQSVRLVGRKIVKTTSANDKLCVGIYAGQSGKVVDSFGQACNETDGYGHAVIALGDTRMSQSDTTTTGVLVDGSVSAGDLLCTSSTAGKLTTQADDIIRSYTVGKAIEDGDASAPVYAYIYCG